ncbi:hypothetical protein LXL04_023168 [Taraxacum kok-saghyz]
MRCRRSRADLQSPRAKFKFRLLDSRWNRQEHRISIFDYWTVVGIGRSTGAEKQQIAMPVRSRWSSAIAMPEEQIAMPVRSRSRLREKVGEVLHISESHGQYYAHFCKALLVTRLWLSKNISV